MIALAIIKNGSLYVYNEKNHQLFTRPASGLTLLGFTASNVSVLSVIKVLLAKIAWIYGIKRERRKQNDRICL